MMPLSPAVIQTAVDGWPLGETKRITSADDTLALPGGGVAIKRSVARALLASQYPDFYNMAASAASATFLSSRTATGLTGVNGIGTDGVNTWIATSPTGAISRSTDAGVTWAAVTSPVAVALGKPCFGNGVWIIPYANGKLLRSTNGGSSWADVSAVGVPPFAVAGTTKYGNGAFIYAHSSYVYWSTDGLTWVDISSTARGSGGSLSSITFGDNKHALLYDGNTVRYSEDGGSTWKSGTSRGISKPGGGLYWTGQYWISGGSVQADSSPPITSPAPSASGYYFSASETLSGPVQRAYASYTVNGSSGGYWYDSGIYAYALCADGVTGAVLQEGGYGGSANYFDNVELLKLVSKQSYKRLGASGGPTSGIFESTESGAITARNTSSNQIGIKAQGSAPEVTLAAISNTYMQAGQNANWYTRVK